MLQPLTKLNWKGNDAQMPELTRPQCVVLCDRIYVGEWMPKQYPVIYTSSTTKFDSKPWSEFHTPSTDYSLTTYQSKLVVVGGTVPLLGITNKLWSTNQYPNIDWQLSLPPMPTRRRFASTLNTGTPEYLVVAGGEGQDGYELINTVEIFIKEQWSIINPLPQPCSWMTRTLHDGVLYFGYEYSAFCCNIDVLVYEPIIWSEITLPLKYSNLVSIGKNLIAIGGQNTVKEGNHGSSDIYALVPSSQSWVHVDDLPTEIFYSDTVVLPTGRLMVTSGQNMGAIFEASLQGKETHLYFIYREFILCCPYFFSYTI